MSDDCLIDCFRIDSLNQDQGTQGYVYNNLINLCLVSAIRLNRGLLFSFFIVKYPAEPTSSKTSMTYACKL
jgi:hypothetical protein